jgi:hypothetical protein
MHKNLKFITEENDILKVKSITDKETIIKKTEESELPSEKTSGIFYCKTCDV